LVAVDPLRLLPVKLEVVEPSKLPPLVPLDPRRLPLEEDPDPVPIPELVPKSELPELPELPDEEEPPVCASTLCALTVRRQAAAKTVATVGKV
jgi:hypothetical protein